MALEIPPGAHPDLRRRIEDLPGDIKRRQKPKGGVFSSVLAPSAQMTQRQRLRTLQSDILLGKADEPSSPIVGGLPSAEAALTRPRPPDIPFTPGIPQTVEGTPGSATQPVPGLGFVQDKRRPRGINLAAGTVIGL